MTAVVGPILLGALLICGQGHRPDPSPLVRSASSGRWSEATTWEAGTVPGPGARVQVRTGHVVTYDARTERPIRSIHVAGTLRFDPDRDTRLDVGLIKIQAGDDAGESGFDCETHVAEPEEGHPRPSLEIGTPDRPISPGHTALIRLTPVAGLDDEECPAIVCCGGRWDVHGSAMDRTWVKLAPPSNSGDAVVLLSEPVHGWRVGDRLVVTSIHRQSSLGKLPPSVRDRTESEERSIKEIKGQSVTLDRPLKYAHSSSDGHTGEVANLSRNVIIESAQPDGVRGHTMYHRHSAGSISYAEFRHLGKPGKLGKYSLHFHRVGDTMRGSSVIGASIWDSGNRWLTIHGTNTLVVRDCVGYRSLGHGFFLEDGTEVENILDRNLAIQALAGKPLPGQVFPLDRNEGAGFWWANSHNAFTRNNAAECDEYGFRYDAPEAPGFDLKMSVRFHDGRRRRVDIRTLPFLRFEDNETHTQRQYGFNMGGGPGEGEVGGVGVVGPDSRHPFVIRNLHVWDAEWGFTPAAPGLLLDGLRLAESQYGFWRPMYDRHAYRRVSEFRVAFPPAYELGTPPEESSFPNPLTPTDDRPPVTIVTRIAAGPGGKLLIRGVAVDNERVKSVRVNGRSARPLTPDFLDWEAEVEANSNGPTRIVAEAVDVAGNAESLPHRLVAPAEHRSR